MREHPFLLAIASGILLVLMGWCVAGVCYLAKDVEVPNYDKLREIIKLRIESEARLDNCLRKLEGDIEELNRYIMSDYTLKDFVTIEE